MLFVLITARTSTVPGRRLRCRTGGGRSGCPSRRSAANSAAGQFAGAYADLHATAVIFPEVPDAVRALAGHSRIAVVANGDHDYLMRCLDRNDLRFDLLVDSETAGCYKPDPGSSSMRATPCRARERGGDGRRDPGNQRPGGPIGQASAEHASWLTVSVLIACSAPEAGHPVLRFDRPFPGTDRLRLAGLLWLARLDLLGRRRAVAGLAGAVGGVGEAGRWGGPGRAVRRTRAG